MRDPWLTIRVQQCLRSGAAAKVDPNLVNAWGLTAGPTTPWWVADNGTDRSTLYSADGTIVPLVVQVPIHPTGTVFWSFTSRAIFVFATEAGTIRGWQWCIVILSATWQT